MNLMDREQQGAGQLRDGIGDSHVTHNWNKVIARCRLAAVNITL